MPLDPMQLVVLLLSLVAVSGLIDRDIWPYIFYYVVAPLISGFVGLKLLETIPSLGMDFGLDRYEYYLTSKKSELLRAAGTGLGVGVVINLIASRFSKPAEKKAKPIKRRLPMFAENVPMVRRRHLKTLGLTNSAGPRDMFLAWTKLSSELQSEKWESILKQRGLDCTEAEFKAWIDEAYTWLRANSDEPVSVAKKPAPVSAVQKPKDKKKRGGSVQSSRQPKMQIRGL